MREVSLSENEATYKCSNRGGPGFRLAISFDQRFVHHCDIKACVQCFADEKIRDLGA